METTAPTPDQLDRQASLLHDTEVWQQIVTGWEYTAPAPAPVSPQAGRSPEEPARGSAEDSADDSAKASAEAGRSPHGAVSRDRSDWRNLLSVPVGQLIDDSMRTLPAAPPDERPLPGRFGAVLPDRLHAWRRVGQPDLRPSTQLGYARQVLTEWGWQNTPYRLRNVRGARCICGALLTAHRLGYGSLDTVNRAGAWLITELRSQGWPGLIGPWNRHPGRTATDALALIDATIHRASVAGH
ncbi:hypothetical protein OHA98_10450 [Streptomyces sp. NBC_00654]|uniref:DUF6197 family protein n=1 Tax=Streptomyces sp. NBC_00654 TaxID=2975799 RepID=UPI0022527AF9|nr:hypothetical protein [Streptomyces sp. NBC_00654]MCX4965242.1 hypothetical protein [Streptomyces sp. NBC_00654]